MADDDIHVPLEVRPALVELHVESEVTPRTQVPRDRAARAALDEVPATCDEVSQRLRDRDHCVLGRVVAEIVAASMMPTVYWALAALPSDAEQLAGGGGGVGCGRELSGRR